MWVIVWNYNRHISRVVDVINYDVKVFTFCQFFPTKMIKTVIQGYEQSLTKNEAKLVYLHLFSAGRGLNPQCETIIKLGYWAKHRYFSVSCKSIICLSLWFRQSPRHWQVTIFSSNLSNNYWLSPLHVRLFKLNFGHTLLDFLTYHLPIFSLEHAFLLFSTKNAGWVKFDLGVESWIHCLFTVCTWSWLLDS